MNTNVHAGGVVKTNSTLYSLKRSFLSCNLILAVPAVLTLARAVRLVPYLSDDDQSFHLPEKET